MSPSSLSCTTQARIGILDHETRFQPRYFAGKTRGLHGIQYGVEVLVGRGRLVLRILAAVRQDVVRNELVVHDLLVERAVGGLATQATACAVVHGVSGYMRARIGSHRSTHSLH